MYVLSLSLLDVCIHYCVHSCSCTCTVLHCRMEKMTSKPSYRTIVEPLLREHDGDASELLRLFPNFDPDANARDTGANSYLRWAGYMNHFHAVRGLVQCGANLQLKGRHGCTPLYWVCRGHQKNRTDMVAWFLSKSVDVRSTVNWANVHGWTPLHVAASCASSSAVRVLLKHGANPTLTNGVGETPSELARLEDWRIGTAKVLEAAERAHSVLALGEWRPHRQVTFPRHYRAAMRTLVILAKAHKSGAIEKDGDGKRVILCRYECACLDLLPEELLQYLFAYITTPEVPDVWTLKDEDG